MNEVGVNDAEWGELVNAHLRQGAEVRLAAIEACTPVIVKAARAIVATLRAGGKVVFCGNGGSAADAQHLAAELVGRYLRERNAVAAIALTTDTSVLTAVGNDYGYARVFERQVQALVRPEDTVVALSTSGRSESVLRAVKAANDLGAVTIAMTGNDESELASISSLSIRVPSRFTPYIQETHISLGHCLCALVENTLQ